MEVALRDGADPTAAVERAIGNFDLDEASSRTVSQQTDRVADGTRVLAVGLAAFAAAAALAALVVISQAVHRRMGEGAPDLPALGAMGFTRARSGALALTVDAGHRDRRPVRRRGLRRASPPCPSASPAG